MILSCPACQTAYAVPDSAIGISGRQVRCAACKASWFQEPNAAAIATLTSPPQPGAAVVAPVPDPESAAAPVEPASEGMPVPRQGRRLDDPPVAGFEGEPPLPSFSPFTHAPPFGGRRNPARRQTMLAGAAATAMLFGVGALAVLGPPDIRSNLGLRAAGASPIQIQMQMPELRDMPDGNRMLDVSGQLINPTDETQRVPPIRAEIRDPDGRVVYSWVIAPPLRTLAPSGRANFYSGGIDIPAGDNALKLTLDGAEG